MSDGALFRLLELAVGLSLVCGYVALWRRGLVSIIKALAVQGAAVAAVAMLLGIHEGHVQAIVAGVLVLVLKAIVIPRVLLRIVGRTVEYREIEPLVNIPTLLLAGALTTVIAYFAGRNITALEPGPATRAVPIGLAVILLGFLLLVFRRKAVTQVVGFLMLENGVAVVAFLTTAGLPLIVELGAALDLLLAVLVLQVLAGRMVRQFGATDLNQLVELKD
jgi:hydrogenase-4 component E